jgi:hypothetical protein
MSLLAIKNRGYLNPLTWTRPPPNLTCTSNEKKVNLWQT